MWRVATPGGPATAGPHPGRRGKNPGGPVSVTTPTYSRFLMATFLSTRCAFSAAAM